jgi:hypothetical protein
MTMMRREAAMMDFDGRRSLFNYMLIASLNDVDTDADAVNPH